MPLIGAQGPGSQIAWRGNLDEYPNEFIFPEVVDSSPGESVTSIAVPINGINYKALFTAVGSGCSVRVTPYDDDTQTYGSPGPFLPGNDVNNPIIIRNNDKIELQVVIQPATQRSDYGRIYPVTVTAGKRPSTSWSVTTRLLDDDPDPFSFTNLSNLQINTLTNSNVVTITGIDDVVGVDVFISSQNGELSINGGTFATSGKIFNGNTLQLRNVTGNNYSTSLVTTVQLGIFSTSFTITTRAADTTINSFSFTPVTNVNVNTTHISNSITISGADENLNGNNPLPISITGGEYKIERNGQLITDFTDVAGTTQNGDVITLQTKASSNYATTTTATVTISNRSGSFSATTRPRPIDTIPNQFTFTDKVDEPRNVTITSNTITLSGMTDFGDEGSASISSASGVNAQFRVQRGGQTIRNYSSSSYNVRNGDQITLRLTSSSNSLGAVSATFTVAGTSTVNVISGINGSTTDTWNVTSAQRSCNITSFNLANKTGNSGGLQPGSTASTSFTATGFNSDCGISASTSNANSYLKIGSRQGTSLTNIQIGDIIEVFMTVPYYDETRTTTVTLTSSIGTSKSADWTIGPVNPPLPELNLDAQNRSVPFVFPDGGTAVLNYSYNYVTQASVTTNFGVTSVTTNTLTSGARSGSKTVSNIQSGSTKYTMTVSNSSGSTSADVTVLVGSPPPPTVTLCPSDTSSCSNTSTKSKGDSITLYWKTTNALRTESPDFSTNGSQNGNVTLGNLTTDDKVFTIRAYGVSGSEVTATHTVNLRPFVSLTSNKTNITTGDAIQLRWSSEYATRVVNTSGTNFSTTSLSGAQSLTPPKGSTTYGITVEDTQGLQSSSTVTVTASDDTTVDNFTMSPSSVSNVNRSSNHTSEPRWGSGTSVRGLSPGVSVTATVSGGVFDDNGTTSKTVQNGTSSSSLKIRVTASSNFSDKRTGTLNIGGVSASFDVTTLSCVVENSTDSHDGISFNTRRVNFSGLNYMAFRNIASGSGNIGRSGNGTSSDAQFAPGSHSWTAPNGVYSVRAGVIGGGGGAGSHSRDEAGGGGGGGGATKSNINCNPGDVFSIRVGGGGNGSRGGGNGGDGGTSDIRGGSGSVSATGGEGGRGTSGGSGGSPSGGNGQSKRGRGSGSEGGHGGGAGSVNGGTCASGSVCGGEGGNGGPGQGSTIGTGGCRGDNCRKGAAEGLPGNYYGGGGSGGVRGNGGGAGAEGRARIDWTINYPDSSKQNVVKKIADAYWSRGRPPTIPEIRSWYNAFRDSPASYPTLDNLYNSIRANVGAVSGTVVDNCGNTFTQSY